MDAKNFLRSIEREAIVAYTNKDGIIEYVNSNFCQISGYSKEELIGQDHRIVNSGYHSSEFFRDIWNTILSGKVWVGDICNRAKDGSIYWVNSTISPSIVNGEIVGFYAVRNDISLQKELEARNAELSRLSDEIQNIANIGGWSYIIESEKFIVTPQVKKILGVPENLSLRVRDLDELSTGKNPLKYTDFIKTVIETGESNTRTFKMISLKGIATWIKATASLVLDPLGKPLKVTGIFQDISAITIAEEQAELERSKSIHSAKLASIGEMSSSIVHEMNNPIASIQANVRMMKRLDDIDEIHSRLEKVEKPVDKLIKLAENLRQYSRGHKTMRQQIVCDVKELVENTLVFLEHRFNYSSIDMALEIEEGLKILCDPSEIEQVIVNLLNNSIDSIEKLRTRWVKIEGRRIKDKICLSFIDSGEGIPKEVRDHIFDSFFTTKDREKGTGLGLGIVKDIMTHHNATIYVDADDPNTKFVLEFKSV